MKKIFQNIPDILKVILFAMLCMLCLVTKNVYADDVVYSTEGGTWTKVNDTTFTMDKDGDGTTDVALVKNGNEWQYVFTVADDKATYYGWEENVPSGYEVIGAGTRANPAINTMTKYSHTPNISDDGVQSGNYANNLNLNDVVNIPGASSLHVVLTYAGESASYDYVCAWTGSNPSYTASSNYSSAISVNGTQKFGGGTGNTVEFDVQGDTVTFGYKSDSSGCGNGYGYYAVVTGSGGGLKITNKSKTNPTPETGAIELTKNVTGKTTTTTTQYSHTANISDDGVQSGSYANNLNTNEVITIPGASQLHVTLTYGGEGASWDWVSVWTGNHPDYTASGNYSSGITVNGNQKFGGGSGTTIEFDVTGESVTFGFKSDGSGSGNGYGYYAVVTGNNSAASQKQYFKFNIKLSTNDANLAKFIAGDKMYGETAFKDGEGLVYLEGGDSVILDEIPSGVNYTITEEPNSDYNVSWVGTSGSGSGNAYSGTIAANTTHEITCTNAYARTTSGGSTTINPVEYGTMKLSKQFINTTGSKNAVFHIAFWNLETNTHYKYSDGINENSFVSDSTGLADVTLNITDNQEFTFSDLPVGCKYQISEEASDYIASYEVSGAAKITQQRGENLDVNQSLTTAKETISKDDNAVVAFKNTGKEIPKETNKVVDIHIKKVWNDNNNAAKMRPDSITVQLTQDGDVVATAVLDNDTSWQADFTDLDKYAEDGVTEYDYEVNEIDVSGYKSEIVKNKNGKLDGNNVLSDEETDENPFAPQNDDSNIAAQADDTVGYTFTITNTLIDVGTLRIGKELLDKDGKIIAMPAEPPQTSADEEIDENPFAPQNDDTSIAVQANDNSELLSQEFRFTVTLTKDGKPLQGVFDVSWNKTGTLVFDENGKATVTLKGGQAIHINKIPAGASYTVKESVPAGYTEKNGGEYTGTIKTGDMESVNVVNTYNPSHKMTIKKIVKGNQGDKTKQFKFQMMLTGNGVPSSLAYTKNGQVGSVTVKNGIAEFTLGHEDVMVFNEMPAGVKYVITELDGESNGYTVESKNASGTTDKDVEVSFTNTKNVGVPTAAMTNTGVIAGVIMAGVIGIVVAMIAKRKRRRNEK